MRKIYFLFLLAFVAAGSMMFIGGADQAHAICNEGDSGVGTVSSVSVSVSGPEATAVVAGGSPYVCDGGVYVANGWITAKLINSSGAVVASGSCGSVDNYPGYSIPCSVGLSGVPAGQYTIKANTHITYNGSQVDGTPKSSSAFTVGTLPNASLSADNLTIPSGAATTLHWTTTNPPAGGTGRWLAGLTGQLSSLPSGEQSTGNLSSSKSFYYGVYDASGNLIVNSNKVTVNVTTAVNGSCTPQPTTQNTMSYASTASGWDGKPFCDEGTVSPPSPSFPSVGGSTSWSCVGSGGGTTASCSASRKSAACTPSWYPSASIVCSGTQFTQTDSNNCETPNTRTVSGTANCDSTFTIAPPSAAIQVGATKQYTGYYDSDGPGGPQPSQTVAATSVTWSSSDTGKATINSSGVATGVAPGFVTIRGTYSGILAIGALTITPTNACVSNWTPDPSGICSGTQFTQTDSNNCEIPNTRTVTGTGPCGGGISTALLVNGSHNLTGANKIVVPYGQGSTNLNVAWQATNANGCDASNSGGLRGWMQNLWNNILKAFNSGSAISTVTQSGTYTFTINCH